MEISTEQRVSGTKFVSAERRNQHPARVRSPEGCCDGDSGPERLNRCIANNFIVEVEEADGPTAHAACNPKTKLVEAKLEMVRATWLFHDGAAVSRIRWIDTPDRL